MTISHDDFEAWLSEMDDRLEGLAEVLPSSLASQLDYSGRSLDLLENWLLSRYASVKDLLQDSEKHTLDLLSTYVGETFRKNLGGVWIIDLENAANAYYSVPVMELMDRSVVCPITLTTAAADRRTGNFLSRVLRSHLPSSG